MIRLKVTVNDPVGFHLRPAEKLSSMALKYEAKIHILSGSGEGNAKSILSILGEGIRSGESFRLIFEGEDEEQAAEKITELMESMEWETVRL